MADNQLTKFRDLFQHLQEQLELPDTEEVLVTILHKMIRWWEHFEVNHMRNEHYKEYLHVCIRILREKPLIHKVKNVRYQLRNTAITILDLIQQKDPVQSEENQAQVNQNIDALAEDRKMQLDLLKTCFQVIMEDSEENAEIAFKIVEGHINALTRRTETNIIDLAEVKDEVLAYCKQFLEYLAYKPTLLNPEPPARPIVQERTDAQGAQDGQQPGQNEGQGGSQHGSGVQAESSVPTGNIARMDAEMNPSGDAQVPPIVMAPPITIQQPLNVIPPPNFDPAQQPHLVVRPPNIEQPTVRPPVVEQPKVIETLGVHSLKFGSQLRKLAVVRWRYSQQNSPIRQERVCDDIKDDLVKVLQLMPAPINQQQHTQDEQAQYVLEVRKFVRQLESMVSISEILVIMIQYNPEFMHGHMHNFFCFFKNLITFVPAHENTLRYNILYQLNQSLEQIFSLTPSPFVQQQYRTNGVWERFQIEARSCAQRFAEYFLDIRLLLGSGTTTTEVLKQVNTFVKTLYDNLGKDHNVQLSQPNLSQRMRQYLIEQKPQLNEYQLSKAIKILLDCMNNRLTPSIVKNQFLLNLHALTQQLVKNCQEPSQEDWNITSERGHVCRGYDFLMEILNCLVEQSTQMSSMLASGKHFLDQQEHRKSKGSQKFEPCYGHDAHKRTPKKKRKYLYETSSSESESDGDDDVGDFLDSDHEQEKAEKNPPKETQEESKNEKKEDKITFDLRENELIESYQDNFKLNWAYAQTMQPCQDSQKLEEQLTSSSYSFVKNIFVFVGLVIESLKRSQASRIQMINGQTRHMPNDNLNPPAVKLLKKLMVSGCTLIQRLHEVFPLPFEERKLAERFDLVWLRLRPSYFRDILHASSSELFTMLIYVKANQPNSEDVGICHFMNYALEMNENNTPPHPDCNLEIVNHFLELFSKFLMDKSRMFSLKNEFVVPLCGLSKPDRHLSNLYYGDIQEAIQEFLDKMCNKTMKRFSDLRNRDTFFSIFVFCVRQIHSGYFARMYFKILRNFLLYVEDSDENIVQTIKTVKQDFAPLIQGLLETFLQRKVESMQFRELWQEIESNEINCLMPAKAKQLLDHFPHIMNSIVDCLRANPNHSTHYHQQIQIGIQTLKDWIQLLNLFPELLDPVINQVLPELNQALGHNMYHLPQHAQRLMAKLGAKTRMYNEDYKISTRNYAEDGLNFKLKDKHSQQSVVLGVDAFINSILYAPVSTQGVSFVRNVFFCYVDLQIDIDFLVASIATLRDQEPSASLFETAGLRMPKVSFQEFNNENNFGRHSKQQIQVSQMIRGSESHTFEKILRYMFAFCTTSSTSKNASKKHIRFMKWVSKYFTLIYIVRNGQLMHTQADEINPLLFIELLNYFFFYINLQYSSSSQMTARAQYNGSVVALKTMLRLLTNFYGDRPQVFDSLEIVRILIKKICQITNLAVNIALQVLIKELPARTLAQHISSILETLFQLLNTASDSIVKQIENEIEPTLNAILIRVEILPPKTKTNEERKKCNGLDISQEDKAKLYETVVDKLAQNILSVQKSARELSTRLMTKIATSKGKQLSDVLQQVKCSIYQPTQARKQEGVQQLGPPNEQRLSWSQYLMTKQVESRSKEILEMFKGGYSQIKQLIAYFDLVQFVLKHTPADLIFQKKHVFLGVSDLMLIILENESEQFDRVVEQNANNIPQQTFNDQIFSRLGKRYMKLEKTYVAQNKEYDPYSFSLHPHTFLSKNHFEVQMQARQEETKKEVEDLNNKQMHIHLKIFPLDRFNANFSRLNPEAEQVQAETGNILNHLNNQVSNFIGKHFPAHNNKKPMDIRFEYLKQLHELYPNVRIHADLIVGILELSCDIVCHPSLSKFMKDRYEEFYSSNRDSNQQQQAPQQQQNQQQPQPVRNQFLKTRFDFYAVEIKSKIICSFFKFFLRDEMSIQKKSKQCLKRLINTHGQTILPRRILNDCVKPILNTVQRNQLNESQFQHFGMLIKIIASCFNEALIKHLTDSLIELQSKIIEEDYRSRYLGVQQPNQPLPNQAGVPDQSMTASTQGPGQQQNAGAPVPVPVDGVAPNPNPAAQQNQLTNQQKHEELQNLIDQYNQRVQLVEVVSGIIDCIHQLILNRFLMQFNRQDDTIIRVFQKTLAFQNEIIQNFDTKFELQLNRILSTPEDYTRLKPLALKKITSCQVKVGFLQSNLHEGLSKIFNFHSLECQQALQLVFQHPEDFMQPVLDLFKLKETVCLRERIQRENLFHRLCCGYGELPLLTQNGTSYHFQGKFAIELIYTISKYYPLVLTQANNNQVLDVLRGVWIRRTRAEQFLDTETRNIYSRIQKILVIYCKNEQSDIQILFDLLKQFSLYYWLDMTPLVQLCTDYIPNNTNKRRKQKILETTLAKIMTSRCDFEQKYMMFEFAFMPIALKCAENQEEFNDLFTPQLIQTFIETFFSFKLDPEQNTSKEFYMLIYQKLGDGQLLSYESFFIEIIKVLTIIVKQLPPGQFLNHICADRKVFAFLIWVAKNSKQTQTKEHVYYTISLFALKLFRIEENVQVQYDSQQLETIASILFLIIEYKSNCTSSTSSPLVQSAFRNMTNIFQNPNVIQALSSEQNRIHYSFKRRYCLLKQGSEERIALCSLIAQNEYLLYCDNNQEMIQMVEQRMCRVILTIINQKHTLLSQQQVNSATPGLKNDPYNHNTALSMIETIVKWTVRQKQRQNQTLGQIMIQDQRMMDDLFGRAYNFAVKLFDIHFDYMIQLHDDVSRLSTDQQNRHMYSQAVQSYTYVEKSFASFVNKTEAILKSLMVHIPLDPQQQAFCQPNELVHRLLKTQSPSMTDRRNQRLFFYFNFCLLCIEQNFAIQNVLEIVFLLLKYDVLIVPAPRSDPNMPNSTEDVNFGKAHNYLIQNYVVEIISKLIIKKHIITPQQQQDLRQLIHEVIRREIKNSMDKDIQKLQEKIIASFYQKQQRQDTSDTLNHLRNWEPLYISSIVPHFAIRLLRKLNRMKDAGQLTQAGINYWAFLGQSETDDMTVPQAASTDQSKANKVYQDLITVVQKLTCSFRHEIFNEKLLDQFDIMKAQELQKKDPTVEIPLQSFEEKMSFPVDFSKSKPAEVNYSIYIRESLILALKLVISQLKSQEMHQDEAILMLDQVRQVLQVFHKFKTDIYTLGQLYQLTKLLVEDTQDQRLRLVAKEKCTLLQKMMNVLQQMHVIKVDSVKNRELIDNMYKLCLDFLEHQPQLLTNEYNQKLYNHLFTLRPTCSYALRQRIFAIFEKFQGSSLKAKMNFWFDKLIKDERDLFLKFCYVQNFLDFTLYNFEQKQDENTFLFDIKMSSSLCPLYSPNIIIDPESVEQMKNLQVSEPSAFGETKQPKKNFIGKAYQSLQPFVKQHKKYCRPTLSTLLKPLSEIVRINPEHTHDKNISEKTFTKLFWQYWNILDRDQQQFLAQAFNKMFQNLIQLSMHVTPNVKLQFGRAMLEAIVAIQGPTPRIEPEVLQYLGKHFKLWHVAMPLLESHTVEMFITNERYVNSLNELYKCLMEEDMQAGLRRLSTESPEMRTMITYGQHHNWEQLNSLFNQYINFYAEQEGLYVQLEELQEKPGKYSRQLERAVLVDYVNSAKDQAQNQPGGQNQPENQAFSEIFENQSYQSKLNSARFPKKQNGNDKVSEIDLRVWETLYVESLRVLNKHERLNDVAQSLNNYELKLECMWQNPQDNFESEELRILLVNMLYPPQDRPVFFDQMHMQQTRQRRSQSSYDIELEVPQNSIQRIHYQIYLSYILLQKQIARAQRHGENPGYQNMLEEDIRLFDQNYRETMKTMLRQYDEQLPGYMDKIQHEYLILLQVALESNEARNMLQVRDFRSLVENPDALKNWRLRLPHMHESIQTWKSILDNRNLTFQLLHQKFQTRDQTPEQAAQKREQFDKVVDAHWNKLQLAKVARKHGLPHLAQTYLNTVKRGLLNVNQNNQNAQADQAQNIAYSMKVERFLLTYETLRLDMKVIESTNNNLVSLQFRENANTFMQDSPQYDPWMQAEILRLQGEFDLSQGSLQEAKDKLLQSIEKNRKEAKTWMAYGKLNEIVYKNTMSDRDKERAAMNALKGYLVAVTLAQHKSKVLIPFILNLIKSRNISRSQEIANFIKSNLEQMPIWIWLFWIPQMMHGFLVQDQNSLQNNVFYMIMKKISQFYPQPAYFALKTIKDYCFATKRDTNKEIDQLKVQTERYLITQKVHVGLQNLMKQFQKVNSMSLDEKLLSLMQITLNFSQYFGEQEGEDRLSSFLQHIYKKNIESIDFSALLKDQDKLSVEIEGLQVLKEIKPLYFKNIIDENTRKQSFLDKLKFIKQMKDFLKLHKNLKQQELHLQDVFPSLANFQAKGIELPGQHIMTASNVISGEPLPERAILIEKFEPAVFRSGIDQKKVHFKCNNSRIYAFVVSYMKQKKKAEYIKFNSDERVVQLKVISNLIFLKNKESAKRGIKFYVAPKILLGSAMLTQDDLTCIDLQDTHDYLLQERGLDPDLAMLTQIDQVEKIFQDGNQSRLFDLSQEQQFNVNYGCYKKMTQAVEPSLLTSYFHRIFYNVDHLFIFKKQFTRYHATNSLFAYAFNLGEHLVLEKMSFCKETGRINFQGSDIMGSALVNHSTFKNKGKDEIEQDNFIKNYDVKTQEQPNSQPEQFQNYQYVPFRLTKNFEHFIGPIGVQGLFAGVMTAGALALTEQKNKYQAFLNLMFADEIATNQNASNYNADQIADFCMYKIESLCKHQKCIEYTPKPEESKAERLKANRPGISEEVRADKYILGNTQIPKSYFDIEMDRPNMPEEYNKKVFALIEMATDEERCSQKAINWCSWF